MAKKSQSPFLGDGGSSPFLQQPSRKSGGTLDDLMRQNQGTRERLAGAGIDDPTKENKPSALERIFGPLDALGTGVRGLVYNAISDEDVNILSEMGKSLKGEKRIEGADILGELGVDNKWGKMLGGFAVDVLLDPLTYLSLGWGGAAKAGGKTALTALAKYGDDAVRVGEAIGKNADDAARIIAIAKESGLIDDAGRFASEALTTLGKEGSQSLMTKLYGEFGKGGVRFAGIPFGGEQAVSKLGYKAKDAARMLPGSRWVEQTFGMGGLPGEAVDLMREGNEAVNVLVKSLRSQTTNKLKLNEAISQRFAQELAQAIPDETARVWASVAIGRQFGDEAATLADKVDNLRSLYGTDEFAAALDDFNAYRSGVLSRARDNIEATLRNTAGLTDDQVAQAMQGIDLYDARLQELYSAQKERGLLSMGVFGDDAQGYLPGVSTDQMSDASLDVAQRIGADTDALRPQTKPTSPFLKRTMTPEATKRKEFLTPLDRVLGENRAGEATDALLTELDLSKLGGVAQLKQGGRVVLKDFQDELAQTFGNEEFARKMAASVESFFTDDEATKGFLKTFDKVTNLWKRQATVLRFPAFQGRNLLSNKILMWQDGALSVAGEAKSLDLLGRMVSKSITEADTALLDEMVEHGVLTTFQELSEQVGKGGGNKVTRWLGEVNTVIENQSRISAYFTYLDKGMSKQAAGEMVNKALFDYSDEALSIFERNVVKRLVPFYKWTKNNLSKQTRVLLNTPGRSTWLGHLMESGDAVAEYDESVKPEWLRELNPVPLPITRNGNAVMLSTEGLFPQNDLELLGKVVTGELKANDVLTYLSPLLRTPLEVLAFNKDVYYDEDIEKYPGQKKRAPQYIESFGDLASTVPGLREVWSLITESIGIEERETDAGEAYYYMSAKAVKAMRDFLPWMNQVGKYLGGADENKAFMDRLSATGVKPIYYDQEQFAQNKAYDDRDLLMAALQKAKDEGRIAPEPKTASLDSLFGGRGGLMGRR